MNWRDIGECWKLIRHVGVDAVTVTELSFVIQTPACELTIVKQCTRVRAVGDGGCDASSPEVDGCAWCVGVGVGSVTELTIGVATPTFDGVVVEDCACVTRSGADCFGGAVGAEVDGCAWCVGVCICSVAKMAGIV